MTLEIKINGNPFFLSSDSGIKIETVPMFSISYPRTLIGKRYTIIVEEKVPNSTVLPNKDFSI